MPTIEQLDFLDKFKQYMSECGYDYEQLDGDSISDTIIVFPDTDDQIEIEFSYT